MLGVFLTAILQGLAGGIGFAIAGISNPVFWGYRNGVFLFGSSFGTAVIWSACGCCAGYTWILLGSIICFDLGGCRNRDG